MAYFDNAATTYPKPDVVYEAMDMFYRNNSGSFGRGNYKSALHVGDVVADTRKRLQALFHCPAKQVVFTPTATIALNIVIQGMIVKGAKKIYISPFEHNAVTRTLHHYEQQGCIQVIQLAVTEDMVFDLESIRYQFDDNKPDFVIVSHASNVFGLIAPVKEIFELGKKYGAVTLVDMAQTAGLLDSDLSLDVYDFAVFEGHKTLYGPTGIGGFVMKPDFDLPATIFGGTGFESANQNMPDSLPERFEVGTSNIVGIAGLNAALRWIEETGIRVIQKREEENRKRLLELLKKYDFIKTVGAYGGKQYVGIVSCLIEGVSSDSAGSIFDRCNIAVRTGLHCAPLAHKFLHTYPAGTVRFSVNYFTSDKDFEELEEALNYIEENI